MTNHHLTKGNISLMKSSDSAQKEVEEERQARLEQVSELLYWAKSLQGRSGGPSVESSLAAQQVHKVFLSVLFECSFCFTN